MHIRNPRMHVIILIIEYYIHNVHINNCLLFIQDTRKHQLFPKYIQFKFTCLIFLWFTIQKFLLAQSIVFPTAYSNRNSGGAVGWLFTIGLGIIRCFSGFDFVLVDCTVCLHYGQPKRTWTGFTWQAFSGLWDFIKLSDASAVMLCLETRYYQIIVLVAGQLKNAEVALDSLSIS